MPTMNDLAAFGQSIWYDYIRRAFLLNGDLQKLIDNGLRGMTSNPAIFEKAIAGSSDYDEQLRQLVDEGKSVDNIYLELAVKDIALAADLMRPVYERTGGLDGYVSLEVSPTLAHDTAGTIAEAKALYERLERDNIMIKVPATAAGIPAIETLIGAGVSINVTLIFSVNNYHQVAEAYLAGLEHLQKNGPSVRGGQTVATISSVASFFVSRVDAAVDAAVDKINRSELCGKIAIANTKVAYNDFSEYFSGERWNRLSADGARAQRLLWASTGTKDPSYPDTMYVDQLIGAHTVNTVPPKTLDAWMDHGLAESTLGNNLQTAQLLLSQLSESGIDLAAITDTLQDDGVKSFAKAFESLMASIAGKRDKLLSSAHSLRVDIGEYGEAVSSARARLRDNGFMERMWKKDYTLWGEQPTEISNRLGWLDSPVVMKRALSGITSLVNQVRADGYTHALLLGMGGSSMAPELFRLTFGVQEGYLDLAVLDSTDPAAIQHYRDTLDPAKTLFVVSTKSGGTVETLSFFKFFYNETVAAVGRANAGRHFVAITDPGSKLQQLARDFDFRETFLNDPDIGGRYSALSYFGLLPAALVGVDPGLLLQRAAVMVSNCDKANCPADGDNSGAVLGALLGQLALAGRDKLTLITSTALASFGAWVEQLVAESTGKQGVGILPVDGEALLQPDDYADDRLFVYLRLDGDSSNDAAVQALRNANHPVVEIQLNDLYDIGGEFFRWEMATAIAGAQLNINPFDQPNVESAKVLARDMVDAYHKEGKLPEFKADSSEKGIAIFSGSAGKGVGETLGDLLDTLQNHNHPRPYIAIQAYVPPDKAAAEALQGLRTLFQKEYRLATTVGFGPRFLHSTGQLHKGDAGNGLFIQFTADHAQDIDIPDAAGGSDSGMSFGVLLAAQALGDRQALLDAGRRVVRFHLSKDVEADIRYIREALRQHLMKEKTA